MRKLLIGLGVVVVLLLVAVVVAPLLIPLETYRAQIEQQGSNATGREFKIGGDISLSILPSLAARVEEVTLANAPGAAEPTMVQVGALDIKLQIWPLLTGEVAVDRFVLVEPVIHLEVSKDGKPNWDFGGAQQPQAEGGDGGGGADSGGGFNLADLRLGEVRLERGKVTYKDGVSGASYAIDDINADLSLPGLSEPFAAKGSAVWNGKKIDLDVASDTLAPLLEGGASKLEAKISSEPITFSYAGEMSAPSPLKLAGTVDLDIPSVRELAAWAGQPLEFPGEGFGPFSAKGQLGVTDKRIALNEAQIRFDAIEGNGALAAETGGARPKITARLDVETLDVNPYLPPETEAEGGGQAADSGGGEAQGDWSDEPIELAPLKLVDADLSFSAGAIKVRKIEIGKSALTVKLNEGVLTADLSELALYQGGGKGKLTLDGSKATPAVQANFDLAEVQAEPLLRDAAGIERLLGTMSGKIAVTSQGKSQRDLVSALDGDGAVTFLDGAIKGINIASMLRSISVSALREGFSESEKTDFAELSGTFRIADGIATNNDLKMVAPLLRLAGQGTVSLPPRTLDYRLEPKAVASIEGQGGAKDLAGIMIPFRVAGPWSSPSFTPDVGGALKEQIKDPEKLKERLKNLVPGQQAPDQGGAAAPSENQGQPATPKPEQLLKGLFGNGGG